MAVISVRYTEFSKKKNLDYKSVQISYNKLKSKEQLIQIMDDWGERSDGGHNYGYKIDIAILNENEIPPKEWFKKAIKHLSIGIEGYEDKIKENKQLLDIYNDMLKSKNTNE